MSVRVLGGGASSSGVASARYGYLYLDDPRIGVDFTSTADQSAKVQAAIDLVAGEGGGTIFWGGFVYGSAQLTLPGSPTVKIVGAGRESSGYLVEADLGAGQAAIATTLGGGSAVEIEGIFIRGPGWGDSTAYGDFPCAMDGFHCLTGVFMRDCRIAGFARGIAIVNDHQTFSNVWSHGNGHNLDFITNPTGGLGDQKFVNCSFSSASRASIAIADTNTIANARFSQNGHTGNAPFGIYRYATADSPKRGALAQVVFENWSFENCSNAIFYDEPGHANAADCGSWQSVTFHSPAEAGTFVGDFLWPGKPTNLAKYEVGDVNYWHWAEGRGGADTGRPLLRARRITNVKIDSSEITYQEINDLNQPLFEIRGGIGNSGVDGICIGSAGATSSTSPVLSCHQAQEAISQFELVESYGDGTMVRRARNDATSVPVGFAVLNCSTGDACVYIASGRMAHTKAKNLSGSTIAQGDLLKPDPAHTGCVKTATSAADGPIVATAAGTFATGTSGQVRAVMN